jgi:hypothetical protein
VTADNAREIEMLPIAATPVTRYRYRGTKIPALDPGSSSVTAGTVESPLRCE